MRKILLSLLAVAGLLLGGLVSSAPATATPTASVVQSDVQPMSYGTSVFFLEGNCSTGCSVENWHIRVWTMNGAHNFLFLGQSARNVRDVCPPGANYRLMYERPSGGTVVKPYGACQDMEWAEQGMYLFVLQN